MPFQFLLLRKWITEIEVSELRRSSWSWNHVRMAPRIYSYCFHNLKHHRKVRARMVVREEVTIALRLITNLLMTKAGASS